MKKFIYIALLVITTLATFSSCTEENIAPKATGNGSGSGSATKGA